MKFLSLDISLSSFSQLSEQSINPAALEIMRDCRQHKHTNVFAHCCAVAYYSLAINRALHLNCNEESLKNGALLHDYFLYDWRKPDSTHRLHGFYHAGVALRNASRDYHLNATERDIIGRHMFPLNPLPPRTREGVLVSIVDKCCATRELFSAMPYKNRLSVQATPRGQEKQ